MPLAPRVSVAVRDSVAGGRGRVISAIGRSNNLLLSGRQFVHQPPAIHLASIDPFWSRYKSLTLNIFFLK